ncbi:ribose-5-phosphate isomerase RpiA [Metabacillus sp. GX 13764]|uniref:ribose-5-phosphate isomerase RpiA n=1 Tax=Metabacillus kandeliae TaxID=2900151 RepID=UPI001E496F8A|nr:ribose-5-phosphate isomerase RpiA [Metabacillus kandeliae]MCD7035032.1 ribose-5-phosphate isomerase RpiA [Metabacillus kandeliae]
MNEKQLVGERAAALVKDGMTVGLGTGSTVFYTIKKLAALAADGLNIKGIPTSEQTEKLALEGGIPLISFAEAESIDIAIDGADEADPSGCLIKGGGGALLREKIIAKAAKKFVVVADSKKIVQSLGAFGLPVEVVPFGYEMTERHIQCLGASTVLRQQENKPFVTDNGNYIFDCDFKQITDPGTLERNLNMIPGVVENGLFVSMADLIITADEQKNIKELPF